ncbi:uncharacterized protein FOMMEDRAFT_165551 [Fomitiporia mediterranea MF3/22]|uniref:uncharacterized protein n=1 Tax=Fomitiporia mediterranea (strain MF3/22) TaxID=694068 RepID=UPI0004408739|nr:uncharacterized protein FOMMEDRAFT_165551 [Fomitiporia mediterranea MF3/22]EJD06872.1 hypothetical protein FOMMEDRAFT_165551 [Fomitiporia mediterranea MF3/22]
MFVLQQQTEGSLESGAGRIMAIRYIMAPPTRLFHSGCIMLFSGRKVWLAYLILVFEATVVFGLLLARSFSYYHGVGSFGILKEILTGGAWYFICIICMGFANMMLLLYAEFSVPL